MPNFMYELLLDRFKNTKKEDWRKIFQEYNRDQLEMITSVLLLLIFDAEDTLSGKLPLL